MIANRKNRNYKNRAGVLILTLCAGVLMSPTLMAQPDLNNAPKAVNPQNRQKKAKRNVAKRQGGKRGEQNRQARLEQMVETEYKTLEAVTGKPLTEDQKKKVKESIEVRETAVKAIQEKYLQELAGITGVAPAEMEAQVRKARRNGAGRNNAPRNRNKRNEAAPVAPAAPNADVPNAPAAPPAG